MTVKTGISEEAAKLFATIDDMSIEDWFLVFVVLFAILSFLWGMFLGLLCGPGDLDFAGYWDWYFRVCNARVP